jgi:hypothetical protein
MDETIHLRIRSHSEDQAVPGGDRRRSPRRAYQGNTRGALSALLVTASIGDAELARGPGARVVDFSFWFPYGSRPAQFKILLVGPRNTREILVTR